MTKYSTFAPGTCKELYEHSDTAILAGISNEMPADIIPHAMAHSWEIIKPLKDLFGDDLIIESLFRGDELNEYLGGSKTSEHKLASAVDFKVKGMKPNLVRQKIQASSIQYSQLIEYRSFCHLGRNPFRAKQKLQYLNFTKK